MKELSIEIPLEAKDSELKGWEYTIPEGMEAEIKDGKIIVREKESEDEKIRKAIIDFFSEPSRKEYILNGFTVDDIIAWIKKQGEKKPAEWSEEDEFHMQGIIDLLPGLTIRHNWLKDLKNRVQSQTKQEWSEEDETNASYICAALDCYLRLREERNNTNGQEDLDKARNWLYNKLKSLRPQFTWKPSGRQMEVLAWCKPLFADPKAVGILESLINDLKKLREE